MFLAKSDKTTLEDHSLSVATAATDIFNQYFKPNKELSEYVLFSALFHDIGKVDSSYQAYIKNLKTEKNYNFHNEIGWAFLHSKLSNDDYSFLLEAIYYSHGTPIDEKGKYNKALKDIIFKTEDLVNLNNFFLILKKFKNWEYINFREKPMERLFNYEIPKVYDFNNPDFYKTIIIRSILYCADRIASRHSKFEDLDSISFMEFNVPSPYLERFSNQKNIIDQTDLFKTSLIKAPTGFGKTLMGLYWIAKNKRKTIWVCPDNSTAISVFNNIKKELKVSNIKLTVELFYASQKQDFIGDDLEEIYNSDIVVTNIDNYFYTFYKAHLLDYSITLFSRNIIFDEYHDFVSSPAQYRFFIEVMKIRNKYCKQKTLLLSATPSIHHKFFEDDENKVQVLPNEKEHFSTFNKTLFNFNIKQKTDYFPEVDFSKGSAYFANSVKNVQEIYETSNIDLILHSKYTEEEKEKHLLEVLDNFKKGSSLDKNIVTSFIGEKAMDVSYKNATIASFSLESLLQRLGRISRWGEFSETNIELLFIDTKNNKSENAVWEKKFSKNLKIPIETFLQTMLIYPCTLNELYVLYNTFNQEHEEELVKFYREVMDKGASLAQLIHYWKAKEEKKKTIKGKTLRSQAYSYNYFVYSDTGSNRTFEQVNVQSDSYIVRNLDAKVFNKKRYLLDLFVKDYPKLEKWYKGKIRKCNYLDDKFIAEWLKKSTNEEYPFLDVQNKYEKDFENIQGRGLIIV